MRTEFGVSLSYGELREDRVQEKPLYEPMLELGITADREGVPAAAAGALFVRPDDRERARARRPGPCRAGDDRAGRVRFVLTART